jgi:hypothetical protein
MKEHPITRSVICIVDDSESAKEALRGERALSVQFDLALTPQGADAGPTNGRGGTHLVGGIAHFGLPSALGAQLNFIADSRDFAGGIVRLARARVRTELGDSSDAT